MGVGGDLRGRGRGLVMSIAVELGLILALVIANGAFSMSELAILSARKGRLRDAAEAGNRGAAAAIELAREPNRFLSTVQIGITLVGTLAGVFGGATLSARVAKWIAAVPGLEPHAEGLALTATVVLITYLSLVLGELVPKRLAIAAPEAIATRVSRPIAFISAIGAPAVALLGWSTETILTLLGLRGAEAPKVTEEEIHGLVREGAEAGIFHPAEHEMVRRVFRLDDCPARVLMTRRSEIAWIDAGAPAEEIRRVLRASPHALFPVCDGSVEKILGYIQAKDLLMRALDGKTVDVRGLVKLPIFVYEAMSGLRVLERFKDSRVPMAIVLDEFGSVEGLLTPSDILKALVGNAPGVEDDRVVAREDGSWLVDGLLSVEDLRDAIPLPPLPPGTYDTLAGFILRMLGRIPRVADRFAWGGYVFEVVDMDDNRIDRVLIARADAGSADGVGADQPDGAPTRG